MLDLIIFTVKDNRYALNLEEVQRVIQSPELTDYPNAHPVVEGMISYENQVIKVLSFRSMTQISRYEEELLARFDAFEAEHRQWLEMLAESVAEAKPFDGVLDPHACGLGKWLDGFTSHDDVSPGILKALNGYHKALYAAASEVLALCETDRKGALEMLERSVYDCLEKLAEQMHRFTENAEQVCNSLQKVLIFRGKNGNFALKVDDIVDIAHIEERRIKHSEATNTSAEFLELAGVLELEGKLINIIKSVRMPTNEVA